MEIPEIKKIVFILVCAFFQIAFPSENKMELNFIRFPKDENVIFMDNFSIRFKGHSHKRTKEGQVSPLIVVLEFFENKKSIETVDYSLTKNERNFEWKDYKLEFGKSDYNNYQEIKFSKK